MRTSIKRRGFFFFGFVLATAFLCKSSIAAEIDETPYARIKTIGSVTMDGNSVREDEITKDGVEIRTDKDSYADINIHATNSHITINPSSVFILHRPKKNSDESHLLKEGSARAKVIHRPNRNFKILTAPAIFGVRGTEFIVTTNSIFNDAEVVVLEGSVEVTSTSDPLDAKIIKSGDWSGVGGRYGKKVTDPLTLPESSVKTLDKQNSTPAWVTFPSSKPQKKSSSGGGSGNQAN